jgi:transposase-like protein
MIDPEPWVSRRHPGPRAKPIVLTQPQREAVETAIRPAKAEKRVVLRGEALLLMAAGVSQHDVARLLGVHPRTAEKWRRRFRQADNPVDKLKDAPRSGRPISLSRTPMRRASKPKRAGLPRTLASR